MSFQSAPRPPDPAQTIAAQSAANLKAGTQEAELNRINQYTPWGSSTYSTTGTNASGTPQYSQTLSLSPEQQQLLNLQTQGQIGLGETAQGMLGQVQQSYANPISTSGAPRLQSEVNQGGTQAQAIQRAQDAAYKSQTQYLDPQYSQAESQLNTQLVNQGLQPGSEAYDKAYGNLQLAKRGAYQSAQDTAVGAGNEEQARLYGQGLSSAQLSNQALNQYLTQLFALRNQPLNEFNALQTGAQVTNPNFQNAPQVGINPTDVAGITNQGYQNQIGYANSRNAGTNALFGLAGAGLGAAGSYFGACDRRLKREIKQVGETLAGTKIYSFRYNNDPDTVHLGFIADEIKPMFPDAISYDENGYMLVNYGLTR